eukprot:TRINITY_DN3868_c0_g2_i1.p1 TRINITY_DN3868_c0_g2~~TRINITY_DN3868_c0_g2_i1.p1  ORF type:complete len:674 (+),score=147.45 TRINITY_DN3868_c0_g2_i1:760-2781(+)
MKLSIDWFVYSSQVRILMICCGKKQTILQGFHFTSKNVILTLPKFDPFPNLEICISPSDLYLTRIYNSIYCLLRVSKKLLLYQMTVEKVDLVLRIQLSTAGPVGLSIIDNLIVVHHLEQQVSMIYDIKLRNLEENTLDFPVAAPLPLSPFYCDGKKQIQELEVLYKDWEFYLPNYVVHRIQKKHTRAGGGNVWQLGINLRAIAASFSDRVKLVDFLLRREKSKVLLFNVLRLSLLETEPLISLSPILEMLTAILGKALQDPTFQQKIQKEQQEQKFELLSFSPSQSALQPQPQPQWQPQPQIQLLPQPQLQLQLQFQSQSQSQLQSQASTPEQEPSKKSGKKRESWVEAHLREKAYGAPLDDENADIYSTQYFRNLLTIQLEKSTSSNDICLGDCSGGGGDGGSSFEHTSLFSSPDISDTDDLINLEAIDQGVYLSGISSPRTATKEREHRKENFLVITQEEFYSNVLRPVDSEILCKYGTDWNTKYLAAVVIEYIRCLTFQRIEVSTNLNEFLINLLVRNQKFTQLHQLLQYHVICDSLPVACQLLSLQKVYPPCYQLALDMLKRLQFSEHLVEILLARGLASKALRYAVNVFKAQNKENQSPSQSQSLSLLQHIQPQPLKIEAYRYLDTALQLPSPIVFYFLLQFFISKNLLSEPEKFKYSSIHKTKFGKI